MQVSNDFEAMPLNPKPQHTWGLAHALMLPESTESFQEALQSLNLGVGQRPYG